MTVDCEGGNFTIRADDSSKFFLYGFAMFISLFSEKVTATQHWLVQ